MPYHVPDLDKLLAGDEATWTAAIKACTPIMRNAARRVLKTSGPEVDDAVASAWMNAWSRRRTIRNGATFGTWCYQVARNAAIEYVRSEWRQRRKVAARAASEPGILDPVAERDAIVWNVVRQLRPRDQRYVELYVLGMKTTEVSELDGIPLGTAKTRLSRALEAVRRASQ